MSTWKRIFRTELLIFCRNKFLAIPLMMNILCWGYIVISYESQTIHVEERAAVFYSGFLWMLLLNCLFVDLLAVFMAGKDRESEFEHLVVTYRVKNSEWIMGKWLVAQLYGFCLTLITVVVQFSWFLSSQTAFSELVKNVFYVFVQMEGAIFLLISLGFLFGIIVKNIFAYVLMPAVLVLSLGLPFDYSGTAYTYDNPRFHLLTPFDYMFIGSPYEGIWGIDRVFASTILHQWIVLLLGILVIFAALLLFRPFRIMKREKKVVSILMAVLLIPTIAFSGIRFAQYNEAYNEYVDLGKQYMKSFEDGDWPEYYQWENAYYESHLDNEPYEFSMEKADLIVDLQADNEIRVQSNVKIKNNGEAPASEVHLTLYEGLQLTACETDAAVTCSRDQDFITVQFDEKIEPGEQFELRLKYEGNILQYREEGYVEQSFIQKNRVYLPKEAGWYPLIGKRQLVVAHEHDKRFVGFELRNARLVEDFPTAFTVEFLNENNELSFAMTIPEIGAGIYKGTSQYGLSLVGGHLEEMTVDGIRVVGHPEVLQASKGAIEKYENTWRFIEEWLEVPMRPHVIYILNGEHGYLARDTPSQEVLLWDTHYLSSPNETTAVYEAVYYLVNETFLSVEGSTDLHLLEEALRWAILSEQEDLGRFKKWYSPISTPMQETEILNQFDAYEKQGRLQEVVKFLYQYYTELETKKEFNIVAALQLYEEDKSL